MEVDPHHIIIEDPDGSCTLILDNLTGVDSGQYMCFAASPAGNASTLGKILVQGKVLCGFKGLVMYNWLGVCIKVCMQLCSMYMACPFGKAFWCLRSSGLSLDEKIRLFRGCTQLWRKVIQLGYTPVSVQGGVGVFVFFFVLVLHCYQHFSSWSSLFLLPSATKVCEQG